MMRKIKRVKCKALKTNLGATFLKCYKNQTTFADFLNCFQYYHILQGKNKLMK